MKKKRRFVGTGPFRWKQATALPNRMYVRGMAKVQANAIATIAEPDIRARACADVYAKLVAFDPKLDQRWFERACNVVGGS